MWNAIHKTVLFHGRCSRAEATDGAQPGVSSDTMAADIEPCSSCAVQVLVTTLSCQGTWPAVIKWCANLSRTSFAYRAAWHPLDLVGKRAPPAGSSSLQLPGESRPSQSSLSAEPGGQYAAEEADDSFIKKLWSTIQAPTYLLMLSVFALNGRRRILHRWARIPKAFSMTRRALLKR